MEVRASTYGFRDTIQLITRASLWARISEGQTEKGHSREADRRVGRKLMCTPTPTPRALWLTRQPIPLDHAATCSASRMMVDGWVCLGPSLGGVVEISSMGGMRR